MWWRRRWAVDPFLEPQRWPSQRAARCLKLRWNAITSSNGYGNSFQAVMKGMTNTERASAQLLISSSSLLKLLLPATMACASSVIHPSLFSLLCLLIFVFPTHLILFFYFFVSYRRSLGPLYYPALTADSSAG